MYRSSAAHFHPPPPPPPPPLPPPLPLLLSQSGCWILDHIPPLNLISITAGLNWWENPCWFHLIAFIYHFVVVVVVAAAAAAAAAVVLFGWWNVFWLFALSAWAFRVTGRSTRWNWSDSSELSGRGQSRLPDQVIPPRSPEGRPTRTVHVHSGPILMIYSKLKKKKKRKRKMNFVEDVDGCIFRASNFWWRCIVRRIDRFEIYSFRLQQLALRTGSQFLELRGTIGSFFFQKKQK